MKKQIVLSFIAAIVFLVGLVVMVGFNLEMPPLPQATESATAEPSLPATEPPTQPPTEPPTEPPTQPPTEPPTEPPTQPPVEVWAPADLGLDAKYAFVYNKTEERLVYAGGDQTKKVAPASLTKLLTAYVALEHMELDKVITVGDEIWWIDPNSSVAWLGSGYRMTVEMLIQGLLMQSGNDAAYALAVAGGRAISGNANLAARSALSVFMKEMNATAKKLGMHNTYFVNPDGIDTAGHYTTMEDLLTLSRAIVEHPVIMRYCGMATAKVTVVSGQSLSWENSNYLLSTKYGFYNENCIGLKTGSTSGAGKCLISYFDDGQQQLLIAVLACPDDNSRYNDTLYLLEKYS